MDFKGMNHWLKDLRLILKLKHNIHKSKKVNVKWKRNKSVCSGRTNKRTKK